MHRTLTALLIIVLSAATTLHGQMYPSKEYIRLGARTIAVENYRNLSLTTAVNATQANPWNFGATTDFYGNGAPELV